MTLFAKAAVKRLTVQPEPDAGTSIRLALPKTEAPKEGYFYLPLDHPNYYALYSLALSAAINRYPLTIRTKADITPAETALVEYMVVDW